ncbi:hypothetical protein C8R43DRAFT_699858 [Mycena crocata]|nr:hypothetical protein C8R43DRAFT_699858 [Mycena crocata]
MRWSLDMDPGGHGAFIAISLPKLTHARHWCIRILSVDFRGGESEALFQFALPENSGTIISSLALRGDLVAVSYWGLSDGAGVLLVNWRTEQCVWLNGKFTQAQPILVPGHLILTYESAARCDMHVLLVCTTLSLARFWVPIASMRLEDRVAENALTPLAHELLAFRGAPLMLLSNVQLSAQASPLLRNRYQITFFGTRGRLCFPP